jgi:hypothetical protein
MRVCSVNDRICSARSYICINSANDRSCILTLYELSRTVHVFIVKQLDLILGDLSEFGDCACHLIHFPARSAESKRML